MSKDVSIFSNTKLPAYLKQVELDAATRALMGSSGYGKRISIRGGRFRMMLNGEQAAVAKSDTLEVVIVAAAPHVSRTYYEGEYNADQAEAPTCWSSDGEKPDASIKAPCAKTCATCPMNVKGSGKGDSKACRYSQRIAVVLANDIEGDIYQLNVSALSLFGKGKPGSWPLQAYVKMVAGKGVPVTALVTAMTFDEESSVPVINFKPVRFLEADEHAAVLEQCNSDDAKSAIEMTVAQVDGVAPVVDAEDDEEEEDEEPAPPPKKRTSKPAPAPVVGDDEDDEEEEEAPAPPPKKRTSKPAPAPVVEDDEEEEDEEPAPPPKKRTSKPAPTPPADTDGDEDFSAILAGWDDED